MLNLDLLERPKRPRTAYNYFFQDERQKILQNFPTISTGEFKGKAHGKIGFADLGKAVSTKWRTITADQMVHYASLANADKIRYQNEMVEFREALQKETSRRLATLPVPKETPNVQELEEGDEDSEPLCWGTSNLDWDATKPLGTYDDLLVPREGLVRLRRSLDQESWDLFIALFK